MPTLDLCSPHPQKKKKIDKTMIINWVANFFDYRIAVILKFITVTLITNFYHQSVIGFG